MHEPAETKRKTNVSLIYYSQECPFLNKAMSFIYQLISLLSNNPLFYLN
jgi:hypothetical protein